MKLSRDTWLGIGILLTLVVVTTAVVLQESKNAQLPYLSTSSAPTGTLALKLWLNELGFEASSTPLEAFSPNEEVETILVIEPLISIDANEWKILDHWIERGGTLIVAGQKAAANEAMQHFDFQVVFLGAHATEVRPAVPLLTSPVVTSSVAFETDFGLGTVRTNYLPLLSASDAPVAVTFRQGGGRVILTTMPGMFTNKALKDDHAAVAVLNLLAYAKPGTLWFDEWHHGSQSDGVVGPEEWLQDTPGGHAILFTVFAVFVVLVLQGRAFGRPVPLKHEIKRRGPMEHVTAIANLNRKAGHRSEVARQYHRRLKRHLGGRYRLDPSMRDEEYVEALAGYNASIDKAELLKLLKHLSQANLSEADLLKYAAEASKWMLE